MKNSLFKRIFATVASVPLAFSQCLTYSSYAVTNDSVQTETATTRAGKEVYNLEKLLYIDPAETESTWYDAFHTELVNIGESENNVRYIEKAVVAEALLKNAGNYASKAQVVIDMLDDDGIQYSVSQTGDITITARIVNNPSFHMFTNSAQKRIDDAFEEMKKEMKQKYEDAKAEIVSDLGVAPEDLESFDVTKEELLDKYPHLTMEDLDKYTFTKEDIAEKLDIPVEKLDGVDSIYNIDESIEDVKPVFDCSSVDFTGTLEVVIKGSDLEDGHTMGIKAKYIANTPVDGQTVFAVGDAPKFARAKLQEIKDCAMKTILDIPSDELDAEAEDEAKAELDKKFKKYSNWIDKIENNKDQIHREQNRTVSTQNVAELIQKINDYIDKNRDTNGRVAKAISIIENRFGKNAQLPASVSAIAAKDPVANLYDTVMKDLKNIAVSYDIDLPLSSIADFADNKLYNISASAVNDTYTLKGDFPDDEVENSYKEMIATVEVGDITNADSVIATVGLEIRRFPQTTTTSTTSTTTTSSSTTDTTTTTTSGTDTDTDTTTTTTVTSDTDTDTTTTTTDTTGTDTDTDTTTTTTDTTDTGTDTDTTTTTTDTTDTGTDTDTTTTTTTDTTGTGSDTGTDTDSTTTTTDTTDTTGSGTDTDSTTTTTDTTGTGSDTGTDTDSTTTTTDTTDTTGSGSDTDTTTTTTGSGLVLPGQVRRIFATVNAADDAEYGFYYSYETEFHKEQVKDVSIQVIYTDDTEETIEISYDFASTPAETFERYDVDFKYTAALVYTGGDIVDSAGKVVLKAGDVLKTADDEDAGVVVYIGYRGDINLDYNVDSVDASQAQTYYALISTVGNDSTNTILSDSNLVGSPASVYDAFASFLGDVNMSNQEGEIVNWKNGKKGRTLDAVDGTGIMMAYAHLSLIDKVYGIGDEGLWDLVLGE